MGGAARENYIYRFVFEIETPLYSVSDDTNSNGMGRGKKKKRKEVEVAFCSLERTAFQISARAYFSINPIRIELRPFVTPHPSKLLSDRALITSFFFFLHRCCSTRARLYAYSDRAHASIIFPAAKLAHPPRTETSSRRQRRLTQ